MAFIKVTKNREGKQHVYLVEGYREGDKVKQRTIHTYGRLDKLEQEEPGILERLKKEAKEGKFNKDSHIEITYDLNAPMNEPDKIYGWKIIDSIFKELKIDKFLEKYEDKKRSDKISDILRLLTIQRILKPNSKISTYKAQEELYGNWDISLNSIYRSLDKLDKIKEDLQIHLHKEISKITNRTANLVFYDVTNYYFETDSIEKLQHKAKYDELSQEKLEKEMRRKGPSKEHHPKPIIQPGLFMDTNGIPISYKLFKGNQTDPITYLPAIETIKKQFGIERLIVVADKAMNSSKNVSYMSEGNDGWVFSQKHRGKRGAPKDIQNFILEDKDWEVNEEMTFTKKSFIRERKIEGKKVKEKVLVTWNKKYAQREQARREGALDYARKLTQPQLYRMTSKKGEKKYLEVRLVDPKTGEILPYKPTITLDEDRINFDAQFDGINVIVTSELTMSDEEIISAYGELSEIEERFRVTKSQLETRPVYVRTPEHIQGHFLICFLALIHVRLLQYKTNKQMSSERIINALKTAKATKLNQGYYRLQESEDMKLLNKLLGIKWEKGIVKHEELNRYPL